jgi:hypothetical protein
MGLWIGARTRGRWRRHPVPNPIQSCGLLVVNNRSPLSRFFFGRPVFVGPGVRQKAKRPPNSGGLKTLRTKHNLYLGQDVTQRRCRSLIARSHAALPGPVLLLQASVSCLCRALQPCTQLWCSRALFGPPRLFDGGPGVGRLAFPGFPTFPEFPAFPEFPRDGPPFFGPLPCGMPPAMVRSKLIPSKAAPTILPARIFINPIFLVLSVYNSTI